MKVSLDEVKQVGIKPDLKKQTLISRIFYRKYSYHFAWFFLKLGMTANQVTGLGLLCGMLSCLFFITNNYILFMIGSFFLFMCIVADFADGSVARYRTYKNLPDEMFRNHGTFMDSLLNFPRVFVIICLSISFINYSHPFLILFIGFISAGFCYMDVGLNGLLKVIFGKKIVHRNSKLARKIRVATYDQATLPMILFVAAFIDLVFNLQITFYYWIYMAMCGVILFILEANGERYNEKSR